MGDASIRNAPALRSKFSGAVAALRALLLPELSIQHGLQRRAHTNAAAAHRYESMGSGASHESATAALAAGVSEADIAAHLASLDKKPVTVFYNPGSSNSLSCAIMGSSIVCCELKVIQLTGEQKGERSRS